MAVKSTYGTGRYWPGVAGKVKWGLDICGFAIVNIMNNTALQLKASQTPSIDELYRPHLFINFQVSENLTKGDHTGIAPTEYTFCRYLNSVLQLF